LCVLSNYHYIYLARTSFTIKKTIGAKITSKVAGKNHTESGLEKAELNERKTSTETIASFNVDIKLFMMR
jgi:hypothetical protein